MAKLKIRHFVEKPGAAGAPPRFFWQPTTALRAAGWQQSRLAAGSPLTGEALRLAAATEAEAINARLDRWRAGDATAGPDGGRQAAGGPAGLPGNEPGTGRARPGSVADLIADYRAGRRYQKLSPRTAKDYDRYLALIRDWAGPEAAASITGEMVDDLLGEIAARSQRTAQYIAQVGSACWNHGLRRDRFRLGLNPFARAGLGQTAEKGLLWPAAAIAAFAATADAMGLPSIGDAVLLNSWLGQRQGDILAMRRDQWRAGQIWITQNKTRARVALPLGLNPALKARLDAALARGAARNPAPATILYSERLGRAYDEHHFRDLFAEVRASLAAVTPSFPLEDHLQLPEGEVAALIDAGQDARQVPTSALQYMHLRHTAVTAMFTAGATEGQIAAVTGHSLKTVHTILDRYLVRTAALAQAAFAQRMAADRDQDQAGRPGTSGEPV